MNNNVIEQSYEFKDIKNLKKLKLSYKEALKFFELFGENEFRKEYPLFKENDIKKTLSLKISLCNKYIKILNA